MSYNGRKYHDYEYLALVEHVLEEGTPKQDRTGTGTISLPFQQMRFDLSNNSIPLLTTKKMFTRGVIYELLWYLRGDTNIKYLNDHNVHIWDEWADENGELGPVYGYQWRKWPKYAETNDYVSPIELDEEVDQIANVIDTLRTNPDDRRMIINAWNVGQIDEMRLPPCHLLFHFYSREISNGRALSCHLYQRSCDVGLGVPFNIVQYSILTHMVAQVTGHVAEEFVWTGGDVHIYRNHVEQLEEQLKREPFPSPTLKLNPDVKEIDDFTFEDFEILDYQCHPTIKMEVSI